MVNAADYPAVAETATATLVTTGMLPTLMLAAAILTAPVSLFLLWLYRKAVLRSMAGEAGATPPGIDDSAAPPNTTLAPLRVQHIDAAALDTVNPPLYQRARRSLASVTSIYVIAGLTYALILTSVWLNVRTDDGFVLTRFLWLMSCYGWPTALAVGMIAAVSRGQRSVVILAYFLMLFAVAMLGLVRNAELRPAQLITFWAYTNAPATILLLAFLHRRVRAAGPLVLSFMVTAVIGSQIAISAMGAGDAGMRGAVTLGSVFGLGDPQVFATLLIGFALFSIAGWWVLKWIGRRYQERKMSDQGLTLDAMWLLFGVVQSITLALEGWAWVLTVLAAFVVYKVLTLLGFKLTGLARTAEASPTLLLLRVFALGGKSERLFDALSKRWLRAGSISMIAGPDLVTSTVQPHEFLDFVGGRLSRQFVSGENDIEQRLRAMDRGPDPDGRYRVNEFFCYANTWKQTMRRLAAGADAVLMDLRSFSSTNQGCVFELQQLIDSVPLTRIVFLIDTRTDRVFLERMLQEAWQRVRSDSPNRRGLPPEARLLLVKSHAADVRGLLKLLFAEPAVLPAEAIQRA